MRARVLKVLVTSFLVIQTLASSGQIPRQPPPKFRLTINTVNGWPENQHWIDVKKTTTSYDVIRVDRCMPPLEYRAGVKIDVAYNGVQLKMNAASPTVQFLRRLRELPGPGEGNASCHPVPLGYPAGRSFDDPVPVSELYDMSQAGDYQITVSEETNPDDPARSTTVRSNTITIVVPKSLPPAAPAAGPKHRSFALCLPPHLTPDDLVAEHLTVSQKLSELKAYCTAKDVLVDGTGKPITFYRVTGCWGNPPFNYQAILGRQQKEIDTLKHSYDVIEMSCNPSGIPIP